MSERIAPKQGCPLVTLVLFAYNQESFIRDAVESVLAQDYQHLEIILSDDASTDETYALMRQLADNYHGPHQILLNRNSVNTGAGGLGAHINQVMALANGELVICAAGDDVSHTHRVSKLVRLWDESGRTSGSFHSAVQVISHDGQPLQISHGQASFDGYSTVDMVRRGGKGVLGASHAFTRDLFTCFGPLDAHAVFEDRILMFRAHLIGTIVYTPEVLVDYRIHDSNLSGKANYQDPMRWQRWIDGAINVLEHFERDHSRANGDRLAPAVASALLSERRRLEGARGIHAPGRAMRVLAAWRFAGDQSLRQRISFAIECAGWSNLPILQLTRLLKRKLLNLFSQMFEIFKTIPIKLLLILKFKILRLFILKILFRRNNLDLTYFEEKLKNRFFIFCVNNVFIASESINWYLSFDKLKKDCEDISLKFYNPMDGDTIVDIGAGRGEEIIVYSRAVGCTGKVIAVEANPQVFSVLSDIVSLNSLKNTEIINIALSAAIGKVCINDDYASYLSGAVNVRAASRKFDVDGVPFSELIRMCNLKKVDFLKVNIEGAERFLTEEVNPLVFKSVKNIAISCHDFRYRKEGSDFFRTKEMILNYFSEAGFHLKQQSTGIDYIDDWVYGSRV